MKHIVGMSGGIDSQAAARWVLNRYPKEDVILVNSDAGGWEDPFTGEFLDWYDANIHPVERVQAIVSDMWRTPGFAETRGFDGNEILTFELMTIIKGRGPSVRARFCTEYLKLFPQKRWMAETFGPHGKYAGEDFIRYVGLRREESGKRSDTPIESWDGYFDCPLFAPIADWTKQMCFDYVQAHGERVNELYKLGFNRVGCAPCVNSNKADILNWSVRRPEMIEKVRGFEKNTGITFFPPVRRDGVSNTIDEVLEWARTAHGGKETLLPIMYDSPPSCESKYGLCE